MRASAAVASLFVVMMGSGCGRAHLFYDARELRHPALDAQKKQALVQTVAPKLRDKQVVWVDADGGERRIEPSENGLAKLGLAELGALWLVTSTGDAGGEADVRVRLAKKPSAPVTVYVDLEGNVRILSGTPDQETQAAPIPSEEEIRERFHLATKLPGRWAEEERRALTDSLASLRPEELEVLHTVGFTRQGSPPDRDPTRAALYEMQGCGARIYLYASGIRSDRFRFVGDASAPRSAVLHSLVHEIGHAFEQAAARERFCASQRERGARRNEVVREGNALVDDNPVLREYLRVLDGLPAPTDYGTTSPHESFAESFALFHVDPAALKRTRPAVHAWFARGGHIRAQGGGRS